MSSLNEQGTKNISIKNKIFFPILFLVILQVIVVTAVIFAGDTLTQLDRNSMQILENTVDTKKSTIENKMLKWADLRAYEAYITSIAKEMEASYTLPASQLVKNTSYANQLLRSVSSTVMQMLRLNSTTGAFIILDSSVDRKEGFYIRDLNPEDHSQNNLDILAELGKGSLISNLGLTMDSNWSAQIPLERLSDFYYKPFNAGNQYPKIDSMNLGYWSPSFRLKEDDMEIITYTIPLLDENHNSYGVLGVEISRKYFESFIPSKELSLDNNGAFLLGMTTDNEYFKPILINGSYYNSKLSGKTLIPFFENEKYKELFRISSDKTMAASTAAIKYLKLYNSNTPFENEQWILAGIARDSVLYQYSTHLAISILLALGIALLISIAGTIIVTLNLVNPIQTLVNRLKLSTPNNTELGRSNIVEIDQLASAIENLNESISQSSSTTSRIIEMTAMPLGVFEYDDKSDLVFCTKQILDICEFNIHYIDDNYMDKSEFVREIKNFRKKITSEHDTQDTFRFWDRAGNKKWVNINYSRIESKILCVIYDVTPDMLEKQKIKYERDYDVLTNLLNRRAMISRIDNLLQHGGFSTAAFSIWDLDNLKYYNDTYGHDTGDNYIKLAANILNEVSASHILVARMSGDEFIIFMYGDSSPEGYFDILSRLHKRLLEQVLILPDNDKMYVSASAGVSIYPDDATSYTELLQHADFAMYEMKHHTKGNIKLFDPKPYSYNKILLQGTGELNRILNTQSVQYAFQPIIDVATGSIFAFEALMRPESELLKNPEDLIRLASVHSKMNLIERITWFMSLKSFASQVHFNNNYYLFINTLPNQCIKAEDFALLEEMYGEKLNKLVLEVTESDNMDSDCLDAKKQWCQRWNIPFALDDFGAGYSNNGALLLLAPAFVKIDRFFITNIHMDLEKQKLISGIIEYCRFEKIKIIAEGVETADELAKIISLGVDYVQGYYLSYPQFKIQDIAEEKKQELIELYAKFHI